MMKKLTLSAVAFLFSVALSAQSLEVVDIYGNIVSSTTFNFWIASSSNDSTPVVNNFHVKNKSGLDKMVRFRREEINVINGSKNTWCWNVCTDPSPDLSDAIKIKAGTTTGSYHLISDYYSYGNLGTTTIRYVFFVDKETKDSAFVTLVFNATATGIADKISIGENTVSDVFPNPSNSNTTLSYSLRNDASKGKIFIYNMLGSIVKEIPLNEKQAVINIPTSELNSGLYFYTFSVDGKFLATKRLIVAHEGSN